MHRQFLNVMWNPPFSNKIDGKKAHHQQVPIFGTFHLLLAQNVAFVPITKKEATWVITGAL